MNSKIIKFAIDSHNNVNHLYDGSPYSVHLSMVVAIALKYIDECIPVQCQEDVINACWLHDTIEDCRLTYNDIKQVAGESVADIVYAVTNEKGKNRKERANDKYYEGIRNMPFAKFVKLCDRIANIQYSVDTSSRMYEVYKKENENFINSLFPNDDYGVYKNMIKDMGKLVDEFWIV